MNLLRRKLKKFIDSYYKAQYKEDYKKYAEYLDNSMINKLSSDLSCPFTILLDKDDLPAVYKILNLDKNGKLSLTEKKFLISTLNNTYDLDYQGIKTLFINKMEIILLSKSKNNQIDLNKVFNLGLSKDKEFPNFDYLYKKFNGKDKYCFLVEQYKQIINLSDDNERYRYIENCNHIIDIFNCTEIFDNIKVESLSNINNIVYLPTGFLDKVIEYDGYGIQELLNYISEHESFTKAVKGLNCDFSYFLSFIFKDEVEDKIYTMASLSDKLLIKDGKFNDNLASAISSLPQYILEYIDDYQNPIDSEIKDFILDLTNYNSFRCGSTDFASYVGMLRKVELKNSESIEHTTAKLITNKIFLSFDRINRLSILENLITDENSFNRKAEFLFNINKYNYTAFFENISDSYLETTYVFLSEDSEVLEAKFRVLNRIKSQLEDESLSTILYDKYLDSLDTAIKGMEPADKIRYLDAHSKFFEKNSIKEFSEKLDFRNYDSLSYMKIRKELEKNKKYKKLKYIFKFANFYDGQYDINLAVKIVDQLANSQTKENAKTIYGIVTSDFFKDSSHKSQLDILKTLPGVLKEIDNDGISIQIPDSQAIESELATKKQMVFVNKNTGIKLSVTKK